MKKTKIIGISLLNLLLLVPFIPTSKAQDASYVGVAEGEKYEWGLSLYLQNWDQWIADNMSNWLGSLWGHGENDTLSAVYNDWSWDTTPPQLIWPLTVDLILPETTIEIISVISVEDSIEIYVSNETATPIYTGNLTTIEPIYTETFYIVNDTAGFLLQNLYGSLATTPYWIMGVPFAPKNINWTEFANGVQFGLDSIYRGWLANTIATAQIDGYVLSVPAYGYINNSQSITINVTYDSNGVFSYHSFKYGNLMLYDYARTDTTDPVITSFPSDFAVAHNYTGQSLSWTATDMNPDTYTITLNGTTTVVSETAWTSGGAVTYNIQDGLSPGPYYFTIEFSDMGDNTATYTVVFTVNPAPTPTPSPPIPGYEPLIVIGITAVATIGLIVLMKKKRNRTIKA